MTLIITDSWDRTSDIVVKRLDRGVFRLNTDIIRDYKVKWNQDGFRISDPTGRNIDLHDIGSVYWRKPFTSEAYNDPSHPDCFFFSECRYLIRELYNVACSSGAFALIEEGAERRLGKVSQLLLAEKYFNVPTWNIGLGSDFIAPPLTVAKSLSGEQIDSENVFYTTRVDGKDLDPRYAWFTQRAVETTADVTVCYIQGSLYAFELAAKPATTDWRATFGDAEPRQWHPIQLSTELTEGIRGFMTECRLRYGRLDFVTDEGGKFFFLEVNPNGQWAWLDLDDRTGLVTAMVSAIRGATLSGVPAPPNQ